MVRPQKEINWTLFEDLCELQCTQEEMANLLKINRDTLRDRCELQYEDSYSAIYKRFSDAGKCSLRRYQFNLSKTNTAMAIWLGKQWLGQRDELITSAVPNDNVLALTQRIMELEHELAKHKEANNKPQAEQELLRGDTSL